MRIYIIMHIYIYIYHGLLDHMIQLKQEMSKYLVKAGTHGIHGPARPEARTIYTA